VKDKLRALFKVFLTALLFGTQTVMHFGIFISVMIAPLIFYFPVIIDLAESNPDAFRILIGSMIPFYFGISLGQVIVYIGVIIFCVAGIQWIGYHHKKVSLFTKGLYAKVRHPQFLGIIFISLGLTIMVLTSGVGNYIGPFHLNTYLGLPQLIGLWFLQVLGYITIALFEEFNLFKKSSEYQKYKQKVPFLFPIKNPHLIPDALFTVLLVLGICGILFLLPYNYLYIPIGLYQN
jgi:protein-S-isoprenylcysteine O-methyltransferase Ste14